MESHAFWLAVGQTFLSVHSPLQSHLHLTKLAKPWVDLISRSWTRNIRVLLMFYRRHLPHWQKPGSALFITWRLYGSIPATKLALILKEKNTKRRFVLFDNELDEAGYGPTWLGDPRLARLVVDALRYGETDLNLYRLSSYVIMSNHVHVLICPKTRLARITKSIKGYTARECNKLLDRTGNRFWQDESFDHAVRNEEQFYRIKRYIERNPVKAGLVRDPHEWPWSGAWNE